MKFAVICCTYARPNLLPHAIESFLRQDYPADQREMIILDDNGQYVSQSRDGWHLQSVAKRFRTLGEKRNATAALASADVDAYVVWDDDDIYLPHTLSAHRDALRHAEWSVPSKVLVEQKDGSLRPKSNRTLFHSAWAFTRSAFEKVHGYPFMQSGQDQALGDRFRQAGIQPSDPISHHSPYLIYRWSTSDCWHLSAMDKQTGYERLAAYRHQTPPIQQIRPFWPRKYEALTAAPTALG
jgi:glycosyltransferase involved in cell wall biosynthesis